MSSMMAMSGEGGGARGAKEFRGSVYLTPVCFQSGKGGSGRLAGVSIAGMRLCGLPGPTDGLPARRHLILKYLHVICEGYQAPQGRWLAQGR